MMPGFRSLEKSFLSFTMYSFNNLSEDLTCKSLNLFSKVNTRNMPHPRNKFLSSHTGTRFQLQKSFSQIPLLRLSI